MSTLEGTYHLWEQSPGPFLSYLYCSMYCIIQKHTSLCTLQEPDQLCYEVGNHHIHWGLLPLHFHSVPCRSPGELRKEQQTGKSPEKDQSRKKRRKGEEGTQWGWGASWASLPSQSEDQTECSHTCPLSVTADSESKQSSRQAPSRSWVSPGTSVASTAPIHQSQSVAEHLLKYLWAVIPFWAS